MKEKKEALKKEIEKLEDFIRVSENRDLDDKGFVFRGLGDDKQHTYFFPRVLDSGYSWEDTLENMLGDLKEKYKDCVVVENAVDVFDNEQDAENAIYDLGSDKYTYREVFLVFKK
tara:strand:- start:1877 stop:2221 length:345 start_codon:yes stop_codon:yes gene_type:complete